jgi:hypothetical protein
MKKKLIIKPERKGNISERNMMQVKKYGGTTGMGTVPMMMFEHGGKFGSYDNRDTGYYEQGGYIWQTTPHMKHGGMPAYGQSFPEANWWGYRSSGPSQFTLPYQLDIKLPPPPEREGPIPTYRNEINSTDYDAATFKAGGRIKMKFRGENHEIYQDGDAVYVNHTETRPGKDKGKWKKFNATKEVGAKTTGQAEHAIEEWHNANPGEYKLGGAVGWKIVDDTPIAQTGTQTGYSWSTQQAPSYQPTFQGNYTSSKTTGNRALTSKEMQALKVYGEKRVQEQKEAEYAARQARIKESVDAQNQPLSAENIMTQSQSTGDKMSFAMNTPFGNPKDYPVLSGYMEGLDYINPGKFIGDMASDLGAVPYNVQQGNYGQALMGVAAPLATGALAGIGTQGIRQFTNNLVNPFAGFGNPFKRKPNITSSVDDIPESLMIEARGLFAKEPLLGKKDFWTNTEIENIIKNRKLQDELLEEYGKLGPTQTPNELNETYPWMKKKWDELFTNAPKFTDKFLTPEQEKYIRNIMSSIEHGLDARNILSKKELYEFGQGIPKKLLSKEEIDFLKSSNINLNDLFFQGYIKEGLGNIKEFSPIKRPSSLFPFETGKMNKYGGLVKSDIKLLGAGALGATQTKNEPYKNGGKVNPNREIMQEGGWMDEEMKLDAETPKDFNFEIQGQSRINPFVRATEIEENEMQGRPEALLEGVKKYAYLDKLNPNRNHNDILTERYLFPYRPYENPQTESSVLRKPGTYDPYTHVADLYGGYKEYLKTVPKEDVEDLEKRVHNIAYGKGYKNGGSIPMMPNGGRNIQDQQGYLASNLQNFTPKKVIKGNKKGTNITTDDMAFPITANGKTLFPNTGEYYFPESSVTEYPLPEAGSGYKVVRSSERKGKTHKVTGPDGTVKFFGDSKLGQHPKDPARKKAFYARHKKNLAGNPYFRAFARKTWEYGGEVTESDIPMAQNGEVIAPFYKDEEDKKRYQQNLTDLWYGKLNKNNAEVLPYLAKDRTKIIDPVTKEYVTNTSKTCINGVCGIMEAAGKYWNAGDVNKHYIGNETFYDNAYLNKKEDVYQASGNFQVGDIIQSGGFDGKRFVPSDAKIIVAIEEDANGNKTYFTSGGSGGSSLGGSTYTDDELQEGIRNRYKVVTRPGYQLDKEKLLAERDNNTSPEDLEAIKEREKLRNWEKDSGNFNWNYSLRDDAPDVNTDNKYVNAFMQFANDPNLVENLARKLNVPMSDVHDELLNTFGELGQESKFGEATTPETIIEDMFKPKTKSIGPGQVRFSTLDPDLKKKLNIKKPKDLYDPDKLIPLMTGINLLNRRYLKNKGENLSEDLMGIPGVDWKSIKGGVGRWTPYMYQASKIDGPRNYARRKLTDDNLIFKPTEEEVTEYYNENPRYFQRVMDPNSYASQVVGYIDRNLKRDNMKGTSEFNPIELMEPVITPSSTKQPYTEKAPFPGQSVSTMEFGKGGMIKRADGSYSRRGLWDNIRANKGSGKEPTPEMLKQERKIKMKEKKAGMGMRLDLNPLPVMPARSAGNGASVIDLHLPKYPDRRTQNLYARPYIFGLSPEKDVNVYGVGANFGLNFLDNSRNTFGVTGGVNNTAVSHPGGFEVSPDPYKSLSLRYVHHFQKGGAIPKAGGGTQTGYSWSTNTAQAPKQVLSTPKDTNISKTRNSALTAIDIKPGATFKGIPFYGDYQDEMLKLEESNTPYIDKLDSMEWNYRFDDDWNALKLPKSKSQKTVNLTQGRFNAAKVPESILDEAVASAIRNRKPVGDLLTLMGRESTFGQQKGKEYRGGDKQSLISGWNLAEKYEPYTALRFLADRGVDGIQKIKDPLGLYFLPDDENNGIEKIEEYLSKNPKVFEEYQKKLSATPNSKGKDYFDLAYEFIDEKGIKGYNPGDPDYVNKYQKDYQLLQQDPELQKYLKSRNIPFDKPQKSQVILPNQPRQIMPELKRGGRISKAQTGTQMGIISDPRKDAYYTQPANNNQNIQQEILKQKSANYKGSKNNPVSLPEVEIATIRTNPLGFAGQSLKSQQTNPANIPASQVASQIFSFIPEFAHTPSRIVNYGIGAYKNKDLAFNPYQSEITETLDLETDPNNLWHSVRNFAINNVADVLVPVEGIAQSSAKFLNNLGKGVAEGAEAYGKSLGATRQIIDNYRNRGQALFATPQTEELLKTVRNVGLSLKNEGDLYNPKIIESVLERAKSLSDSQFKNLTGFEKSELENRLKQLLSGELKKPEVPRVDGMTREEFVRQHLIDLRRPERRQRLQELSTNINSQNPTGWQTLDMDITRPGNYDINRFASEPNMFLQYYENSPNIIDKLNTKLQQTLNKKLNLAEQTELSKESQALINGIFAREGEAAIRKKLIGAVKRVKGAKKGENFIPSSSLSTDSYPLSYKFLPNLVKEGEVDLGYHGMKNLNSMGFSEQIGIPLETNLREINTVIENINKVSKKKFPYAVIKNNSIDVPVISATKLKLGGKISLKRNKPNTWQILD